MRLSLFILMMWFQEYPAEKVECSVWEETYCAPWERVVLSPEYIIFFNYDSGRYVNRELPNREHGTLIGDNIAVRRNKKLIYIVFYGKPILLQVE